MTRILVVADVPPEVSFPNGYSARLLHFLRALSTRHVVDVLALTDPSMATQFRQVDGLSGVIHRVEIGTSPLMQTTLKGRALRARHYCFDRLPFMSHPRSLPALPVLIANAQSELVIIYLPHLAHLAGAIPAGIPVICVLEEGWERALPASTSGLGGFRRRLVLATEGRRVHRLYRRTGRRCSGVVLISEDERRQFASFIPMKKLAVFPHGVDCQHYSPSPLGAVRETTDIAVVADFLQPRNLRGLQEVVTALRFHTSEEYTEWRWNLVGRGSTEALEAVRQSDGAAAIGRFDATGAVADVRKYYDQAKVILVPDLEGTGVKTTVLQAWAMAKPVVATTAATRGLPVTPGTDVLVGEAPADLLRHIHDLLQQPALRKRIARAGHNTVTAHRDVSITATSFVEYCDRTRMSAK